MSKARSLVGLDVHATKIVAAVLDVETGGVGVLQDGPPEWAAGGVLRGVARAGAGRV